MEKINFEDATLKKSAYVTIGGTEYPVTDALMTQWSNKYRSGLYNVVNEQGGNTHNNMPPYETLYFWKRTA